MSEIATAILKEANQPLALFVDFDGTLVDLADTPDAIVIPDYLSNLLQTAAKNLDGALALVSGRPVAELETFLRSPPIAMSGSHGAEHRAPDGSISALDPEIAAETQFITKALEPLKALDENILIEEKTAAVAVHFRLVPDFSAQCLNAVMDAIKTMQGWTVSGGKAIVEARREGIDKGAAVERFMQNDPFAGHTPVFLGDDVTDEDGMTAAEQFGGFGIKVGEGESRARFRLENTKAVHELLAELTNAGGG